MFLLTSFFISRRQPLKFPQERCCYLCWRGGRATGSHWLWRGQAGRGAFGGLRPPMSRAGRHPRLTPGSLICSSSRCPRRAPWGRDNCGEGQLWGGREQLWRVSGVFWTLQSGCPGDSLSSPSPRLPPWATPHFLPPLFVF